MRISFILFFQSFTAYAIEQRVCVRAKIPFIVPSCSRALLICTRSFLPTGLDTFLLGDNKKFYLGPETTFCTECFFLIRSYYLRLMITKVIIKIYEKFKTHSVGRFFTNLLRSATFFMLHANFNLVLVELVKDAHSSQNRIQLTNSGSI